MLSKILKIMTPMTLIRMISLCKLPLLWMKVNKNKSWFSNLKVGSRSGSGLASNGKSDPDPDRHHNDGDWPWFYFRYLFYGLPVPVLWSWQGVWPSPVPPCTAAPSWQRIHWRRSWTHPAPLAEGKNKANKNSKDVVEKKIYTDTEWTTICIRIFILHIIYKFGMAI